MIMKIETYRATYDAIQKRLEDMGKADSMRTVMLNAINDLARDIKSSTYQETTGMYAIKNEVFQKNDIRKRTSKQHLEAVLKVKGSPLGIWEGYEATGNAGTEGASATIKRAGGRKPLEKKAGGRTYKAFIATMKNGHEGIFQRRDDKFMEEAKRPQPAKRIPRKKRKRREAVEELLTLSRSKAVEMAYRKNIQPGVQNELVHRMLKHMNAVIRGKGGRRR